MNGYVEEPLPSNFSALSGVGGYYSVHEEIPSGYYLHAINGQFVITAVRSSHEEGEVLETFDACTGVVYYLQDLHRFAYIDPADSQLKPLKLA